jgi:signal transduction histidine kinase
VASSPKVRLPDRGRPRTRSAAIDAMDGEGTLTISTQVDGADLVIAVSDTGPGMPADVHARAFEPGATTVSVRLPAPSE